MKKFFSLILLLAFSAQTFSQGIVLLNFYINRTTIAKNLCENRFRPMLHCNGNCVLAKKIKAQQNKEQQQPELKLNGKVETISCRSLNMNTVSLHESSVMAYPLFAEPVTSGNTSSVFRPPCL